MNEIVDVCQTIRGQLRTIGLSASGIHPPGEQQAFEVRLSSLVKRALSDDDDLVVRR